MFKRKHLNNSSAITEDILADKNRCNMVFILGDTVKTMETK